MIKVYPIPFDKINVKKYRDNSNIDIFYEKDSKYFEFFSNKTPIGFFRLRYKNGVVNHGNAFVYENQRGKGWGNKILFVSLIPIKEIFSDPKIVYLQIHKHGEQNIYINDKLFGIENRYTETVEPNRFGFKEKLTIPEYLYYDTIDSLLDRNKKKIDELEVILIKNKIEDEN